jgi:hypothetical protein
LDIIYKLAAFTADLEPIVEGQLQNQKSILYKFQEFVSILKTDELE